jgi:hypothetical protein
VALLVQAAAGAGERRLVGEVAIDGHAVPPPPSEPSDPTPLVALAAEYGIEILGAPGIPS